MSRIVASDPGPGALSNIQHRYTFVEKILYRMKVLRETIYQ